MHYLLLALWCFMLPAHLLAAEDSQQSTSQELSNPFSDYVPFEDEYDVDEDERFMYFGKFFAVSLGTGLHVFSGNIGKVYNTALPVLDLRLIYFFDFRLAGSIGISNANHAYYTENTGYADVNIMSLNADLKYYFETKNLGAAIASTNPYVVAGIANTFRSQNFQGHPTLSDGTVKDNAFAYSLGTGMEFALKPRKTSLGIEGRWHKINFKDAGSSELSNLGVNDLTGDMYSIITNITFFF